MKTNISAIAFSIGALLVIGCSESTSPKSKMEEREDALSRTISADSTKTIMKESVDDKSIYPATGSSSAAVENLQDTLHKFIRTADIKFKVENVAQTTYKIENIVVGHGGFVTYTNLASTVNNTTKTQISADSLAEITNFTVVNSIILRVPNTQLDTTLKDIAKLVGFLDYRVIKADDVSLQLLANQLLQKRTAQHTQRLAKDIDANPKKLDASVDAEDNLLAKQAAADDATISNLSLAEQRQYSTVKLELYQPETVAITILVNPKPIIPEYKIGFGTRLVASLLFGWNMLEEIFLAIVNLWVLVLLGLAGYIWYRKYVRVAKAN